MGVSNTRIHIMVPEELVDELDKRVGKRGRSKFVVAATAKELRRVRLREAIKDAAGALSDVNVPGWETPEAAVEWVRDLRKADEERLDRLHGA